MKRKAWNNAYILRNVPIYNYTMLFADLNLTIELKMCFCVLGRHGNYGHEHNSDLLSF